MEEAFASLLRSIDQHTHQLTTEISPENYLAMSQLPLTYPWSRLVFDFKDLHTACSLLILKIFKPTTSSIGHSDSHFRPRLRRVVPDASPPLLNDMDHADTKHLAGLCDAQPFNSTVSQYCAPGCPVFMPTGYRPVFWSGSGHRTRTSHLPPSPELASCWCSQSFPSHGPPTALAASSSSLPA